MAELIFESTFDLSLEQTRIFWHRHDPEIIDGEINMHVDRRLDFSPERADVQIGDWIDEYKKPKKGIPLSLPYGEETWIGFSFRIPDWIPDNPNLGSLIFQLKAVWDANEPNDHPFLPLYVQEDKLMFVSRGKNGKNEKIIGDISNNSIDIIIKMKAHLNDGYFEIWKDGESVWTYAGSTYKHDRAFKVGFGPYIWYWKSQHSNQPFNEDIFTRTVYFDSMRVAVGENGYDLVNPVQEPDSDHDHKEILERLGELENNQTNMSVTLIAHDGQIEDLAQVQSTQKNRLNVVETLLKQIGDLINWIVGE